jgi:DNA-directed RNA polymerase specialized sigma24 family protein
MQTQRRLYAYVYALIRNPTDAEDVFQETNREGDQLWGAS